MNKHQYFSSIFHLKTMSKDSKLKLPQYLLYLVYERWSPYFEGVANIQLKG